MKNEGAICWFVEPLMEWWMKNETHSYPWRETDNLFHAIIAEILLQRTRRDIVIRIYNKFIQKYKNPNDVLNADRRELLRILRPLGLIKRTDVILNLAKKLADGIPKKEEELKKLPGIGDYTAAIVSAVHLQKPVAAVDKNVARIFIRLFGIKAKNPKRPQDDPNIRKIAQTCLPKSKVREYNLALLDLGWEICRPKKPKCSECPLRIKCFYAISCRPH